MTNPMVKWWNFSTENWRRRIATFDLRTATAAERRAFYGLILQITWLAPAVRRAVMTELGLSARAQKNELNKRWAWGIRWRVSQREKDMRNSGEPLRGIRTRAIASIVEAVAEEEGKGVDTIKRELHRIEARR